MYETFEHTADLGLRVRAAQEAELFAQGGKALFSVLIANPDAIRAVESREFELAGEELDFLFFDWLNELLYAFAAERWLFREFSVDLADGQLRATCWGERIDRTRHHLEHEVKAITYHGLRVERVDEVWLAEVIIDI